MVCSCNRHDHSIKDPKPDIPAKIRIYTYAVKAGAFIQNPAYYVFNSNWQESFAYSEKSAQVTV